MENAAQPWAGGGRLATVGLAASLVGAVAFGVGLLGDPERTLQAYLVGFALVASLVVGALAFLMTVHAGRSEWPVAVRRLIEACTAVAPLLVPLVLPVLLGLRFIYPWRNPGLTREDLTDALRHLGGYYNAPFFVVRTVVYLAVWIALASLLRRWSLRQDQDGDPRWLAKAVKLSSGGLVVLGFTLTWAAFDWLMSLHVPWNSSVYGLYYFAGGFLAAFALVVLLMGAGMRERHLEGVLKSSHFLSMGKLLLAFVVFWTYIFFSQFFLIWIADLPDEVSWWKPRMEAWGALSVVLVAGHFALPFFVLLLRDLKRRPYALSVVAGWLLVVHAVDLYWLVMPSLHPDDAGLRWQDLLVPLLAVGPALAFGVWRARRAALVPWRDPRLAAAIAYEGS